MEIAGVTLYTTDQLSESQIVALNTDRLAIGIRHLTPRVVSSDQECMTIDFPTQVQLYEKDEFGNWTPIGGLLPRPESG